MPLFRVGVALLISTWSILSIGFVIASIVPTARFAQPIGAVILYPMLGALGAVRTRSPRCRRRCSCVAQLLPLTYAVSLLQGIWSGDPWSAHLGDIAALALVFVICTAISSRVFRWE